MRILFLASYFPKPLNPAMGVWALCEAQQLLAAGADVRVVSLTSWVPRWLGWFGKAMAWTKCPKQHDWNGLPVEYPRWPFYQFGVLKELWRRRPELPLAFGWLIAKWRLRSIIRAWQPDVIFAHHGAVNGYVALRLHEETGIPYVVKDYDFVEIEDCRRFAGRRYIYSKVARSATTMLAASERMKSETLSQFPGVDVQTSHNGTDPIPARIAATSRPPELQNRFVIASAGIFYERKAFPLLVRAFSKVAAEHPNIVLRIVGDGPERAKVEAAVRESPVADRISLLGMKPHDEVLRELVWCDIFALIGWDEPFATVYLEAMSAGKPILCANDGGINDVLVSGEHGLTVPPRDEVAAVAALERLVADEALRRHCSERAKDLFNSRLNSKATATKLLQVLQAAAQQRPISN